MRCSIIFAGVLAVATAAPSVVHQLSGPEVPGARTCTPTGTKCAGDEGRPAVSYAPCCDSTLVCGFPTNTHGQWGRFCLSVDLVTGNKSVVVTTVPTMSVPTAIVPTTTKTVALSSTTAGTTATGTDSKGITATTSATTRSSTLLSSTATKKTSGGNGSKCFPADATVELESGAMVRMDALAIGDSVKVGVNQYSRVFMFTHKSASVVSQFVTLKTSSGASLALTKGHYIYVNGALAAASTVAVGDELTLGNGETSAVTAVGSITGAGLFNPQTVNGNVVVNGVVSSTYTIAVEPNFAHAILAPFRLLNNFGFSFTALESGGGLLAAAAPRGARTL